MATIKSFTDISQSRKLAEILPMESADCFWDYDELQKYHRINWFEEGYDKDSQLMLNENNVCAWSLTTLLSAASIYCDRLEITLRTDKKYNVFVMKGDFVFRGFDECSEGFDNLVDACVEIILKLNELKLL